MAAYLQLRHITKRFYSVTALHDVSVDFNSGEIHVVIGENGAGKSTLMKIVAGLYQRDEGDILLEGKPVNFRTPLEAIANHISMIHQELMPVPYLTVAQNIFLGREPVNKLGLLDKRALVKQAQNLLDEIGIDIDPRAEMRTLSVAQIQLVEIAKAVSFRSRMLIMDEPTSALDPGSTMKVEELMSELKKNYTVVIVTHNMQQAARISDRTAFFLLGELVECGPTSEIFSTPKDKRTEDYISGRFG